MAQTKSAEEKAAEARQAAEAARAQAETDAEAARLKAAAEEQAAVAKANAHEQKQLAGGDLVVLDSLFVARVSKDDRTATRRYRRGEKFNPVSGLHDVDRLIALGTLGKSDGKTPLKGSTALSKAQAAAEYNQENSPVLDLSFVPFEQAPAPGDEAREEVSLAVQA